MEESEDVLTITDRDGVVVLVGEIDASTVSELSSHLGATEGDVVVDLSGVDFIDSSGLRALIGAKQQIDERGCTLELRSPSPAVTRLFELSSVDSYFTIV